MPIQHISVTVPILIPAAPGEAAAIQVDAAAPSPEAAVQIALVLAEAVMQLRHPGREARIAIDQVAAGTPAPAPPGLHLYVLSDSARVLRFDFPERIEPGSAQRMADAMAGMGRPGLYGVIADCGELAYMCSMGLGAFAGNAQRLRLHLVRPPPAVLKIITLVGLDRAVPCYPEFTKAGAHLVETVRASHGPR